MVKEENLTGLLEFLAKSLVDDPDAVKVDQFVDGNAVHLELQVGPDDVGRVIGKHGRVANAMRTLLRVVAARSGKQISMDVIDAE